MSENTSGFKHGPMRNRTEPAAARTPQSHAKPLVLCALFCTLITLGAFVKIPVPLVPFTLQFLFTTMAGLLLGPRWGTLSVLAYVGLGLLGLPIFASGGGIGYVLQPSFGYLLGFCAGTYFSARIAWSNPRPSLKRLFVSCFVGLAAVYLIGMAYFYFISNFIIGSPLALGALVLYCFVLAVPGDLALCCASALLAQRLSPLVSSKKDCS